MNFLPLGENLLVRRAPEEETTKNNLLVIPDVAREKPARGEVLAVGLGRLEDGQRVPPQVQVGDAVLFAKYGGTDVAIDGEQLLVLRESEIIGIELGPFGQRSWAHTQRMERERGGPIVPLSGPVSLLGRSSGA